MSRAIVGIVLAAAVVGSTAGVSLAQTSSTSTETKNFEIIAVDGNDLTVRLPEGTRNMTVADDFRFIVNGQPLSVRDLKPGMKGSATITTRTTVTPVTVTEVKNGTVVQTAGSTIIVRTEEGFKSFSQGDVDKRGVKIMRSGKPAQLSDFRQGDRLSATIITSLPPKVLTEREVQATTVAAASGGGSPASASASASSPASGSVASGAPARRLPKTASAWPVLGLASVLFLAIGLALTARRRFVG